jgi:hypothetical protein
MCIRIVECLTIFTLLLGLSSSGTAGDRAGTSGTGATFIVLVTWNDANNTPATDVYIEAHTFNANNVSERSFVLKMVSAGRYEAVLPPGVYDVFVSEAGSVPRCRRMLVNPGYGVPAWKLMLEHDDVYLQR